MRASTCAISAHTTTAAAALCGLVTAAAAHADPCQPTIINLQDALPEAATLKFGSAVSADGSVVLGQFTLEGDPTNRAFIWDNGVAAAVELPPGSPEGPYQFYLLSGDGRYIVGIRNKPEDTTEAVRFDRLAGELTLLGGLDPASGVNSSPAGVSHDGQVVTGRSNSANTTLYGFEGFIWTPESGMSALGPAPTGDDSQPLNIAPTGGVVVGTFKDLNQPAPLPDVAFTWTPGGGYAELLNPPAAAVSGSIASQASGDGAVVAGYANTGPGVWLGLRWTNGRPLVLPDVPGGDDYTVPSSITSSGAVISGVARLAGQSIFDRDRAFLWTEADGTRLLTDVLADAGLVLGEGEYVQSATISADGAAALARISTLGSGGGDTVLITLPVLRADLDRDGAVDTADLDIVLSSFAAGSAGDANGDGVTDAADLNLVLAQFGMSCGD